MENPVEESTATLPTRGSDEAGPPSDPEPEESNESRPGETAPPSDDPTTESRRGKRASAKTIKAITEDQVAPLFHLSLEKAAKALGISATSLKKVRRRLNIAAWPYRKFREIDAQIHNTKKNIAGGSERQKRQQTEHLTKLEEERAALVQHCLKGSSRRNSAAGNVKDPTSAYFAFDDHDLAAHERYKKARLDSEAGLARPNSSDYTSWDALQLATLVTPEDHGVASLVDSFSPYGGRSPTLGMENWTEFARLPLSSPASSMSQPTSPTHLLANSLNAMNLCNAAALGFASARSRPEVHGLPSPSYQSAAAAAAAAALTGALAYSSGLTSRFNQAQNSWANAALSSGPTTPIDHLNPLHMQAQSGLSMQRTYSAPPDFFHYANAQQQRFLPSDSYRMFAAASNYDTRYMGHSPTSSFGLYDHHHHHPQHHVTQSGSFGRDEPSGTWLR